MLHTTPAYLFHKVGIHLLFHKNLPTNKVFLWLVLKEVLLQAISRFCGASILLVKKSWFLAQRTPMSNVDLNSRARQSLVGNNDLMLCRKNNIIKTNFLFQRKISATLSVIKVCGKTSCLCSKLQKRFIFVSFILNYTHNNVFFIVKYSFCHIRLYISSFIRSQL